MNAQQYLEHWKQGEERGNQNECPPSESPRTDKQETTGDRMQYANVVSSVFARQLEHELNSSQAAIVDAIVNILSRGGDEEWPIIKRLRAALKTPEEKTTVAEPSNASS